jgi:hypothetical protein
MIEKIQPRGAYEQKILDQPGGVQRSEEVVKAR